MIDATTLFSTAGGSVTAPAGCGKTELIARAAGLETDGRVLILTHTHAGVRALSDRLRRLGVASARAHIETIAGWCLRYARAYVGSAKLTYLQPEGAEWEDVYHGVLHVLSTRAVKRVVEATYCRLFVDEYQDCTLSQHGVVRLLAEIIPTCVLGDPLQGIFEFAGAKLSWTSDVESAFPRIGELDTPWRWKGKNEALGRWLLSIREPLAIGGQIDLSRAPVRWQRKNMTNQISAGFGLLKSNGEVVAIRKWPQAAHAYARSLGARYQSMEELECSSLLSFAKDMDAMSGPPRAMRLLKFGTSCLTEVSAKVAGVLKRLEKGEIPDPKRFSSQAELVASIVRLTSSTQPDAILEAMHQLENVPDAKLYREELWMEAKRVLKQLVSENGQGQSMRDAAWSMRNRLRAAGRRAPYRTVSRTLLVKGLEYSHALVPDADEFNDAKKTDGALHFYVAMTRASQSLTVLSSAQTIQFPVPTL